MHSNYNFNKDFILKPNSDKNHTEQVGFLGKRSPKFVILNEDVFYRNEESLCY